MAGYQAGITLQELGAAFGLHRTTVSGILKRAGVNVRYRSLGSKDIELAIELYESGLSLVKVADRLSCNGGTVWRAFKQQGVVTRDCQGRQR